MSANLSDLDSQLEPAARDLVDAAGSAGLLPRVTSTLRSRAEQTRLYRRAQQGLQKYPVAPPGSSSHEYGLAFDMIVSPFDAIYDVGATWKSWGGGWSEKDVVHFELPGAAAYAAQLGRETANIANQPTSIAEDVLNIFYGFIPVLGEVQMAADLATLFPNLRHNETLLILANPTKFVPYIQALVAAYR